MMAFTISPTFKRWPEPVAIVLDMIEDVKHMFLGGSDPLCTVDNNDHSALGHLADLGIDALRLFPYATLLAVAVAFFAYLPVIAGGIANIATVSNPVAPINGAPANNVVPSNPSVVAPTMVPSTTPLPTATFTPTATSEPTSIPSTLTPTLTPTDIPTTVVFVTVDKCDLQSKYGWDSGAYLPDLIQYLNREYAYYGLGGDRFYIGRFDYMGTKKVIVTLAFKKDVQSKTIALPADLWGPLPTNQWCKSNGVWSPMLPAEGKLP